MASIHPVKVYVTDKNGDPVLNKDGTPKQKVASYYVSYRRPNGKPTKKRGFARKRDAEEYLHSIEHSKSRGEYIDAADSRKTINEIAEGWLAAQKQSMKPSAYRSLDSAWRVHVEPHWGTRRVGGIKHSEVQVWVTALAEKRSATTVLRCYGLLGALLDLAVKDRCVLQNVARDVILPRKKPKKKPYLNHGQVQKLAGESAHPTLVMFLAYTGLRWGEATALRIKHIDPAKRRVQIEENAVMVNNLIVVGTPKNHEERSVPYPAFLSDAIKMLSVGKDEGDLLFGDGKTHMRLPNSKKGWFQGAVKRVMETEKELVTEAKKRGEQAPKVMPRVTPHDLRHTAASLAVSAGANVLAVQRMLGHKSAAMTLDVYADLFEDDLDQVADALDAAKREADSE